MELSDLPELLWAFSAYVVNSEPRYYISRQTPDAYLGAASEPCCCCRLCSDADAAKALCGGSCSWRAAHKASAELLRVEATRHGAAKPLSSRAGLPLCCPSLQTTLAATAASSRRASASGGQW